LRLGDCGYDYDLHYIDYEYLDHAYYIIDYLDIDISATLQRYIENHSPHCQH
jgi:hypothetical protein